MDKRDLKKFKIEDYYVISPSQFLMRLGIECSTVNDDLSMHDLHYILQNQLRHVSLKKFVAEHVFRGEIILIGTPNKFLPYYNPFRYNYVKRNSKAQVPVVEKIEQLEEICFSELCQKYDNTRDEKYLDELHTRLYSNATEENAPTRQKIYCKEKKHIRY